MVDRKVLRVLLVDDHNMLRGALRIMLSLYDDVEIVGEARNGQEAIQLNSVLKPDIVLMDLVMSVIDGY
jgi:two-component system, NarL family, response regulator LiaR